MSSLIINLSDISEAGKDFDFKKGSDKDLDAHLESVIESLGDYTVHCHLASAGDIYTAVGNFHLKKEDLCSLCGEDMTLDQTTKFSEYVVVETSKEVGHAPHSGLNYETTQETYFIDSMSFDVFAFFREIIAAALPPYPKCSDTAKCEKVQAELKAAVEAKNRQGHPAFSVLEKLKKH